MSRKLDMRTFNDILVNSGGMDKEKLLMFEIDAAYRMKIVAMEELVDELNEGKDYKETLAKINNIDSNLDYMHEELKKLPKKEGATDE